MEAQCKTLGHLLNRSKCEVISRSSIITQDTHQLNQFTWTNPDHAMLLGVPLSTRDALSEALTARTAELRRMLDRLADVATHDALILLRYSVSAMRLLHTLRCCPCADHLELTQYDAVLRSGLSRILNLPLTDEAWIQASLPIKRGGLGIRSVTSLALPAFLASAASTDSLQAIMLGNAASTKDETREELKIKWSTASTTQCLEGPLALKQSAWDKPLLDKTVTDLLDRQPDQTNQARLKAISTHM